MQCKIKKGRTLISLEKREENLNTIKQAINGYGLVLTKQPLNMELFVNPKDVLGKVLDIHDPEWCYIDMDDMIDTYIINNIDKFHVAPRCIYKRISDGNIDIKKLICFELMPDKK